MAELRGSDAGREALLELAEDARLSRYHFYWAARAELELRSKRPQLARQFYEKAKELAQSDAERLSYDRKIARVSN